MITADSLHATFSISFTVGGEETKVFRKSYGGFCVEIL